MLALALWWGFLRDDARLVAQGTRIELNFGRLADGTPPTQFDTGQSAHLTHSPELADSDIFIRAGRLTYRPTTTSAAAAYFSSEDLGAPVKSLGASWVFTPGREGYGAIALVVSRDIQVEFPPIRAPIPIHFVATAINWNLSLKKADGDELQPIAAGFFDEPLAQDGRTIYSTSIAINGDAATIALPDGKRHVVRDARISQWQGNFATFELYSNNGLDNSVGAFTEIWADAQGQG
ncbi:hypothetical protein ACAG25_23295 [Mycobacterium sp. pV006]|uniref:hypothetical protein n=1 Tax=Mycobacterium sp. pV006 TaxID=3238983 RepID=UPI00351BB0A5